MAEDVSDTPFFFMLGHMGGIQHRINFDRLSREEAPQRVERRIGVGNRPILLPLMPAATSDGLDLHHEIAGIRQAHDQTARLTRLDLNGPRSMALWGVWLSRSWSKLGIALHLQQLRHVLVVDEDVGEQAAVKIAAVRDDPDRPVLEEAGQPLRGVEPTCLGQFWRVDAPNPNPLRPIPNRVPDNRLDLPGFQQIAGAARGAQGSVGEGPPQGEMRSTTPPAQFAVRTTPFLDVMAM